MFKYAICYVFINAMISSNMLYAIFHKCYDKFKYAMIKYAICYAKYKNAKLCDAMKVKSKECHVLLIKHIASYYVQVMPYL